MPSSSSFDASPVRALDACSRCRRSNNLCLVAVGSRTCIPCADAHTRCRPSRARRADATTAQFRARAAALRAALTDFLSMLNSLDIVDGAFSGLRSPFIVFSFSLFNMTFLVVDVPSHLPPSEALVSPLTVVSDPVESNHFPLLTGQSVTVTTVPDVRTNSSAVLLGSGQNDPALPMMANNSVDSSFVPTNWDVSAALDWFNASYTS
jgi:hypothetical protein